eukprot:scaffold112610_cov66-Phaeocystis_antarctica.AAC.3
MASRNRCADSTQSPELESVAPRLLYASGRSGFRAIASRRARAALRKSFLQAVEAYRAASASSSSYSSPICAAIQACSSAILRVSCCLTPPTSRIFRPSFTSLWYTACSFQAPGFPGQLTPHQYVVGTLSLTHLWHTECFSRSSSISDGSRAQPKQARLSAACEGALPSSATDGAATVTAAAAAAAVAAAAAAAAAA